MRVVDAGHQYFLHQLDRPDDDPYNASEQLITFVKREGEGYPGNEGSYPGTTSQEVMRALIARTEYVDAQIPCMENKLVLFHLRRAIYLFEQRAAKRHGRTIPEWKQVRDNIETLPVCAKCGHIGCQGACHE